mmetsp:Transcript_3824/g.11271  ORF Transcript_3824/g.11271 Transcript_3824/m.11271 type:complete len:209 (+) Transcript_3824:3-629(+)
MCPRCARAVPSRWRPRRRRREQRLGDRPVDSCAGGGDDDDEGGCVARAAGDVAAPAPPLDLARDAAPAVPPHAAAALWERDARRGAAIRLGPALHRRVGRVRRLHRGGGAVSGPQLRAGGDVWRHGAGDDGAAPLVRPLPRGGLHLAPLTRSLPRRDAAPRHQPARLDLPPPAAARRARPLLPLPLRGCRGCEQRRGGVPRARRQALP